MTQSIDVRSEPMTFSNPAAYLPGDIVFIRLPNNFATYVGIVASVSGDWVFARIRKNGIFTGIVPYAAEWLSVIGRIYDY